MESSAAASKRHLEPLAVLVAPAISEVMHDRRVEFSDRVAPRQSWIALDHEGRVFAHLRDAPELESIA